LLALLLIGVPLLVAANAVFVAAEYALVRSRPDRLEALQQENARGATLALRQIEKIDEYIAACQVGITLASIGIGAVVLRRRSGENWQHAYELVIPASGDAGAQLLRLFAAMDVPLSDTELLDSRFALVSGHRLDQALVYQTEYALREVTITLEDGVGLAPAQAAFHALPNGPARGRRQTGESTSGR